MSRIHVALWSKFPESFVREKIIPGLMRHGIYVDKLLNHTVKTVDLSNITILLVMNENASHNDTDRLKILAHSYKKKILTISRKQSSWGPTLAAIQKAAK